MFGPTDVRTRDELPVPVDRHLGDLGTLVIY